MAIFGSYINRDKRLFGESLTVTALDTFAALLAGLVIFPACFAFGVNPGGGPGLIFVTLPNIFNTMHLGQLWGTLFFLFMSFAAMSTVVAVFENIVAFAMDSTGCSRAKSSVINLFAMIILSLPCALSFSVLSGFTLLGGVLDFEDFILSNNLLPLGGLTYVLFCVSKLGWGWDNFIKEADTGNGPAFPKALRFYFTWIIPLVILVIFGIGYYEKFLK
jgi:NSS family neurotransmitter:Na+ symporter